MGRASSLYHATHVGSEFLTGYITLKGQRHLPPESRCAPETAPLPRAQIPTQRGTHTAGVLTCTVLCSALSALANPSSSLTFRPWSGLPTRIGRWVKTLHPRETVSVTSNGTNVSPAPGLPTLGSRWVVCQQSVIVMSTILYWRRQ